MGTVRGCRLHCRFFPHAPCLALDPGSTSWWKGSSRRLEPRLGRGHVMVFWNGRDLFGNGGSDIVWVYICSRVVYMDDF